jgi:hypothetical protein
MSSIENNRKARARAKANAGSFRASSMKTMHGAIFLARSKSCRGIVHWLRKKRGKINLSKTISYSTVYILKTQYLDFLFNIIQQAPKSIRQQSCSASKSIKVSPAEHELHHGQQRVP